MKVFSNIEVTLGLYTNDETPIKIDENSIFVGIEGSEYAPQKLWCQGSEDWKLCEWFWQDNYEKRCEVYIDIHGDVNKGCNNVYPDFEFIHIDKEGLDCTVMFYQGLKKGDQEGSWRCRLQTIGAVNSTDDATAEMRILNPPSIALNTSSIKVYTDENIYIKGVASDAYPATSISWKIEERTLLEVPKEDCDSSMTEFCDTMTSVLKYVGTDGDTGKQLEFVTSQTDSFGNIVTRQQAISIEIIDDGTNGGGVNWTTGKI